MNKKSLLKVILILSLFLQILPASAQEGAEGGGGDDVFGDSLRDITTVLVIGAGGAILGLSTLSFVDEPKDHLKNVVVGGAIGIIIGVGYVAWSQANKSKDVYQQSSLLETTPEFDTSSRVSWHHTSFNETKDENISVPQLNYQFTF